MWPHKLFFIILLPCCPSLLITPSPYFIPGCTMLILNLLSLAKKPTITPNFPFSIGRPIASFLCTLSFDFLLSHSSFSMYQRAITSHLITQHRSIVMGSNLESVNAVRNSMSVTDALPSPCFVTLLKSGSMPCRCSFLRIR